MSIGFFTAWALFILWYLIFEAPGKRATFQRLDLAEERVRELEQECDELRRRLALYDR